MLGQNQLKNVFLNCLGFLRFFAQFFCKGRTRFETLYLFQDVLKKAEKALGRKPDTLNDIAKLDTCVTVVDCKAFSGDLTSAENLVDRFENIDEQDEQSVSTLLIDQIEFAK